MDIFDLLLREEGYRAVPYLCSERYPTIGIGTRIGPQGADINLYQMKISKEVAKMLLKEDLDLGNYDILHEFDISFFMPRYIIIQSMIYQLGMNGFCKFKKTINLMGRGLWGGAAIEMLDSRWADQCFNRAKRHSDVIYSNDWSAYEEL